MRSQRLSESNRTRVDLDVDESAYFGRRLGRFDNLGDFPFRPDDGPLTRHSYVYQEVFSIGQDQYGGIQLRARVHTYGDLPPRLKEWLRASAHRAAAMFDSSIETTRYGPPTGAVRGTQSGDGYLSGFNSVREAQYFKNEERSRVPDAETDIGVIDWSVEIYLDDSFDEAHLSGIAQGLSYPYRERVDHREGTPSQDVSGVKWDISFNSTKDGGSYEVHPPGRSNARKRYQDGAGAGKTVYINGKPIGTLDTEGRAWLNPEYAGGDGHTSSGSWGTYWSREGLVAETEATYQALRKGGALYQTGETESAIYLSTSRARPDGWTESDPDDVSVDMEATAGSPGVTFVDLELPRLESPLDVECRRDETVNKHMGLSDPTYAHQLGEYQRWR